MSNNLDHLLDYQADQRAQGEAPVVPHEWIPVYIGMPNIGIEVEVKTEDGGIREMCRRATRGGDEWTKLGARGWEPFDGTVTHWRRTAG